MKSKLYVIIGAVVLISLVVFAELRQRGQKCNEVIIHLDEKAEYQFFDKKQIKQLLTGYGTDHIEGMSFKELDLVKLEKRVLKNRLITKCQISKDLSGNLAVTIQQHRPIARLINYVDNEQFTNVGGNYLTDTGAVVPLSGNFTARTLLVSGDFFRNLRNLQSTKGKNLILLLNDIAKDPFWKAQITELRVEEDGEIVMLPQVGDYKIDFGLPEDSEAKFKKLKIFYKTILPHKGWEAYKRVSVKFRNQIVCE